MLRLLMAYRGISASTPQQVHDDAGDTWEMVITCAEGVTGDADLGGTLIFKDSLKRLALSQEGVCEGMEGVVECLEGLAGGRWEDAKGEEFLLAKVLSTWEAGSGDEVAAVECLRVNTHVLNAQDLASLKMTRHFGLIHITWILKLFLTPQACAMSSKTAALSIRSNLQHMAVIIPKITTTCKSLHSSL
jgi:hypothetical protein